MGIANADAKGVSIATPLSTFVYNSLQYRVVFGFGTVACIGDEAERLGIKRALVLTTHQQREQGTQLGSRLGSRFAGIFSDATMHTPIEVTEAAIQVVEASDIDGLIAVGGGSTVGLGKALSLRTGLPQIALPTTYAGSEMTPILGETRGGIKTTQRSHDLVPDTVIYDVDLTFGLPPRASAASGVNAIAHAVEALYAPTANPVVSLMAEEGIRALAGGLRGVEADGSNIDARSDCLYGAWLCGTVLGVSGGTWIAGLVAGVIGAIAGTLGGSESGQGWWRGAAAGTFQSHCLRTRLRLGAGF